MKRKRSAVNFASSCLKPLFLLGSQKINVNCRLLWKKVASLSLSLSLRAVYDEKASKIIECKGGEGEKKHKKRVGL